MEISLLIYFQLHFSIQNSLFSTQHIVHITLFFCIRCVERERAEDRACVGSFPIICKYLYYTQLLFGDNDLNNHNDDCSCNVIAKLQTYKNKE